LTWRAATYGTLSIFGFWGDRRFADGRDSRHFHTGFERFFAPAGFRMKISCAGHLIFS
jgi:hypothetical protein